MARMPRRSAVLKGFPALVLVSYAAAQPDSMLVKVRTLGLPEAEGAIPVIYVPSDKDYALRVQKSIQLAHLWYEKQLNVHMPLVVAVLDSAAREKISDSSSIPHAFAFPTGLIVMPVIDVRIPRPDHPEFLGNEPALFHEDGHILASRLGIWSGNPFVNELVGQVFAVAYMAAERKDLAWKLDHLRAGRFDMAARFPDYTPRYTSLADLDYLHSDVGTTNYIWFQQTGLGRLAVFLTQDQSFPAVVEKLQRAFPSATRKQETLEEISRHLETIQPGFLKAAGALAGPTTIPRIMPSACSEQSKSSGRSTIVVRNDSPDVLVVTDPEGQNRHIRAHSCRSFQMRQGASLKLPNGSCLTARDEPTVAVIDK